MYHLLVLGLGETGARSSFTGPGISSVVGLSAEATFLAFISNLLAALALARFRFQRLCFLSHVLSTFPPSIYRIGQRKHVTLVKLKSSIIHPFYCGVFEYSFLLYPEDEIGHKLIYYIYTAYVYI